MDLLASSPIVADLLLASNPLARYLKSQKSLLKAILRLKSISGKPVHFHFTIALAIASALASTFDSQ